MSTWTHTQYIARLNHETRVAANPRAIDRLKATVREVETHLDRTDHDPDVDDWINLLNAYVASRRHIDQCSRVTGGVASVR